MAYDLHSLETGYQQQLKTPPQAVAPKKKGNFFTGLLPSAGGIGGSLGGAALGTAILPGVGTLAGALLGGAVGGGAGKVAENAVEHNKLSSGVAGEAALNGVLGAGPLRLGKFGVDAVRGGLAAKTAGTSIADALKGAGTSAANMSITKALGNKLTKAGDDLLVKQFRLTPKQLTNFQTKFGEDASQVIKRYGFKSAGDVTTKGIKPLQSQYDELVKGVSQPVNFDDFAKAVEKRASKLINSAAPDTQKAGLDLLDHLNALRLNYGKEGFKNGAALNKVKNDYDALVNYTEKQANPGKYTVNKHIADSAREVLNAQSPELGKTGQELSKLHQLSKNTLGQENVGRGSLPLGLGNLPGVTAGGAAGGLPGAVVGFRANAILNSPAGRRALASGALKAGERLTTSGAKASPFGIKAVTGRVAPVGLAGALMGAASQSSDEKNMPMTAMQNNASAMPSSVNMPPLNQTGGDLSSALSNPASSPFDISNVEANLQKLVQGGASDKDVQNYLGIVSALTDLKAKSQTAAPKLNSTQLQQANNAQSGLDSLSEIAQTLQKNPNAAKLSALPGGSLTQSLTHTGSYAAAINNATDVIGRLRSGGAINADEEKRFKALLPGSFDNADTVNYKLSTLAQLFQSFANPQSAQPDSIGLASALGA